MKTIIFLLFAPFCVYAQSSHATHYEHFKLHARADSTKKFIHVNSKMEHDEHVPKRSVPDFKLLDSLKLKNTETPQHHELIRPEAVITRTSGAADLNNIWPADVTGAVSQSDLISTTNEGVLVRDKAGDSLTYLTFTYFWNAGIGGAGCFDPRSGFWHNRYIISSDYKEQGIGIAISDTNNATAGWNTATFNSVNTKLLSDYPQLGYNDSFIVVTVNYYSTYTYSEFFILSLQDALAGNLKNATIIVDSSLFGFYPCRGHGDTMWLVANYLGAYGNQGLISTAMITGNSHAPKYRNLGVKYTSFSWADLVSQGVPQSGSTTNISCGDDRVLNACYFNHDIYMAHTVGRPDTTPTHACADFVQLTPSPKGNPVIKYFQRFEDPTGVMNYSYPCVGVNDSGDVGISMQMSSANIFTSSAYSYKMHDSASFTQPVIWDSGQSAYTSGSSRWGDYLACVVDPVNQSFWLYGMWPSNRIWQPGNRGAWNVGIANLSLRYSNPVTFSATNITATTATLTVPANTANLIEYYYQAQGATAFTPSISPQLTGLLPATTYNVNCVEVYYSPFSIKPLNEISFTTLAK